MLNMMDLAVEQANNNYVVITSLLLIGNHCNGGHEANPIALLSQTDIVASTPQEAGHNRKRVATARDPSGARGGNQATAHVKDGVNGQWQY